jgi:hypothetical protein
LVIYHLLMGLNTCSLFICLLLLAMSLRLITAVIFFPYLLLPVYVKSS